MTTYENILYEPQKNGVLITLNRPEAMNSLSVELRADLNAALDEAEQDDSIRYIILTGAGRAFSAGANMRGSRDGSLPPVVWPYGLREGQSVAEFLDSWRDGDRNGIRDQMRRWEYPKPIIGAINGWALGAASWLALTTHITIASENAVFGQPEVRHISNTSFFWVLSGRLQERPPLQPSPATTSTRRKRCESASSTRLSRTMTCSKNASTSASASLLFHRRQ